MNLRRDESSSQYRQCVPPCPRFITSGDTHSLCMVCLGVKHVESALEGAGCLHFERFPLRTLRSRRALFEEGVFASTPQHSWGSHLDLAEGMETGGSLSLSSPVRSIAHSLGSEARSAVSSPQRAGSALHLSPSEEEDVESTDYSPIQSPQYEELLEVVTRAVAKLNIDWPTYNQTEKQRNKLDERFLRSKSLPLRRSLPFFPDLHTEVSRSWRNPFSCCLFIPASNYYGNVAGLSECGYRAMPRVEQTLAGYLSPGAASSLKALVLPTKPLRVSSVLVGKGYTAAGQAGACLHTMSVLQAYQPAERARWGWANQFEWYRRAEENRWFSSPRHQGDRPCHWAVLGSAGGSGEALMVDSVRHEREGQSLPDGCPACAFWAVRRRRWLGCRQVPGGM